MKEKRKFKEAQKKTKQYFVQIQDAIDKEEQKIIDANNYSKSLIQKTFYKNKLGTFDYTHLKDEMKKQKDALKTGHRSVGKVYADKQDFSRGMEVFH